MAKFMTRVELHNADADDYANLHKQMESRGFSRTILGSEGKYYQLPTAEYVCEVVATTAQVRDTAREAAKATKCASWVITCEYSNAAWYLDEA